MRHINLRLTYLLTMSRSWSVDDDLSLRRVQTSPHAERSSKFTTKLGTKFVENSSLKTALHQYTLSPIHTNDADETVEFRGGTVSTSCRR